MRLVIDLQGAQGTGRYRGIGRFSCELALAMARQPRGHDVIIALNGALATGTLLHELAAILPRGAVRTWQAPSGVNECTARDPARRRVAEAIRAEFLASLQPDLVHVSSVFEGWGDDVVTRWPTWRARLPMVATGYDLIPLIRREMYLDGPWRRDGTGNWYLRCLQEMRLNDAILAISASSRREFIEHIGFDPQHAFNIRAGIGPEFKPSVLAAAQRAELLQRYGLRPDYILFLGGGDFRKNEAGLIRAYGLLPPALRARNQLVIVGKCNAVTLRAVAQGAGIDPSDLALVPFVNEDDLPALYSTCALFVLPSLHEGFGLPAVEAMACGAPVIASNTTSLPEVVGRADALFDPSDPAAIAALMRNVLENAGLRDELVVHGARQAAAFTWPNSAARAWDALEATHDRLRQGRPPMSVQGRRLRLAYVSPLPPEKSGIADYSAELVPELARHYDITLVSGIPATDNEILAANFPLITPEQFLAEAEAFDRVLYQVGNSAFHAAQLEDLLPRIPGVVTLHDAFLSGVRNWVAVNNGRGTAGFTEDLYRSHGWPAVLQEMRAGINAVMREFPCSLPVLQSAIGIIQHSLHGRDIVAAHFGRDAARDILRVPELRQRFVGSDRALARERLGIPEDQILVCSFGYISPEKLPARLLAAWQQAGPATSNIGLVFVGQADGACAVTLKEAAARQGRSHGPFMTGYVDAETYGLWLSAADVAVQLRTDSRGETSRAVLDCMAAGLPTVVNAHGSAAELPDDIVFKLPSDFTDASLAGALLALRDPALRQRLSAKARWYVENDLSPRRIAADYHAAIEAAYATGSAAARYRTTQSLSYALLPDGGSADLLADCARAMVRNFPAVHPLRLLIDVSAWPKLRQDEPAGALVAALLSKHALDARVDLVAPHRGGWRFARAQAAALLGLPRPPAPDEQADLTGVAALLCVVPPEVRYDAAGDHLRALQDAGVTLAVVLTGPPASATGSEMCAMAAKIFTLHPADVGAVTTWLDCCFPGSGKSAVAAGSPSELTAALLPSDAPGLDGEAVSGCPNPASSASTVADQGTGLNACRTRASQSASPARSSIASRMTA